MDLFDRHLRVGSYPPLHVSRLRRPRAARERAADQGRLAPRHPCRQKYARRIDAEASVTAPRAILGHARNGDGTPAAAGGAPGRSRRGRPRDVCQPGPGRHARNQAGVPGALRRHARHGDPAVIEHGGRYYLYPTGDNYSYDVYVSRDLVRWDKGPKVFRSDTMGVWAPDVFFSAEDGPSTSTTP